MLLEGKRGIEKEIDSKKRERGKVCQKEREREREREREEEERNEL